MSYGLGISVPGGILIEWPWERKAKCDRLAMARWRIQVVEELAAGSCDYGGEDWQHQQWCAAGADVRARWVLGEADLR